MPAEWERHRRCWMAWPVHEELWGDRIDVAREAFAEAARAISAYEPVTVVAGRADVADVSLLCGDGIGCLPMDHDDSWLRDSGPTFLADGSGNIAGVDWIFNGWGERYTPYDRDADLARLLLERLEVPRYESSLVLEGGAIHTDGAGTLLTTESVAFDPARNGHMNRREVEDELREYLGIETVIWLGEGLQDDDTGGHVDNIACFARPGVVLALTSDDPDDSNYDVLQDNLARLRAARDARGKELEIVEIRQPAARRGGHGRRLALSYINFYLANDAVVVPSFEDAQDDAALRILAGAFPKRTPVQVPALDIVRGGGGLHCITQQQPSGVVAR